MRIAFLGLGKMGTGIAGCLIDAGHSVTVWNRTASAAGPLIGKGAKPAARPAEAVAEAEVAFTMLNDDAAVEQVVLGTAENPGFLLALRPGAIHVSLSTISVKLSKHLAFQHAKAGKEYVAAPVFGRPNVAVEGKLWVVVGGKDVAIAKIRPLLEAISRGLTIVSEEPSSAHALKIGGNFLITAMIESLSEAMVFAEAEGIDPGLFTETINNALFRSPFYEAYGKVMLTPPEQVAATITLGAKDMGLFRDAAREVGVETPLADQFADDLAAAYDAGLKDEDWAAGLYKLAKNANRKSR